MPRSQLTERTLDVLEAVAALGSPSMSQIEAQCRLATTTTHRIMRSLVERGFLMRIGKGEYCLGSAAISLARRATRRELLQSAARPHLRTLSKKVRNHVHLGVWQEGLVTYLIKQSYGKVAVHSSEGSQLEGYCSALGKILLSGLSDDEFAAYLTDGAFVPMTANTIIAPHHLRREIADVKARGWATDDEEIAPSLRCIAVPLRDAENHFIAAISVSTVSTSPCIAPLETHLPTLFATAEAIKRQLFPHA